MNEYLAARAEGELPSGTVIFISIRYIIPRCNPDKASMWEAPLARNVSIVSFSRPLLSPVINALISAPVSSDG